jgi:hypothetical protein
VKITLGSFQFFPTIRGDTVFASQSAPSISTTPGANFATATATVVDTGGEIAAGVNDTGGKISVGVNDTGGKLHTFVFTLNIICKHSKIMK